MYTFKIVLSHEKSLNSYTSQTSFIMVVRFNSQIVNLQDYHKKKKKLTLWERLLLPPPYQKPRLTYHVERENLHFQEISAGLPYQPRLYSPANTTAAKGKKRLLGCIRHAWIWLKKYLNFNWFVWSNEVGKRIGLLMLN